MNISLTLTSRNRKTGDMPVSTTSAETCPDACPLAKGGCYAKGGPLAMHWKKVTSGERGDDIDTFARRIAALPEGTTWRHNQAGDLPGVGDHIDGAALSKIVRANVGRFGFTYTHKPMTARNQKLVAEANRRGFVINLSANNLKHADMLAGLNVGPVVVILPKDQLTNTKTPEGRTVVVCPAYTHGASCSTCKLCARPHRPTIVGFPAHGTSANKTTAVAHGKVDFKCQ